MRTALTTEGGKEILPQRHRDTEKGNGIGIGGELRLNGSTNGCLGSASVPLL